MSIGKNDSVPDGTGACDGAWDDTAHSGLAIENDGNQNLSVTITTDTVASAFVGGTAPVFAIMVLQNESTTSCVTINASCDDEWCALTSSAMEICDDLNYDNTKDTLWINLNVSIHYSAPANEQNATLTLTGTTV